MYSLQLRKTFVVFSGAVPWKMLKCCRGCFLVLAQFADLRYLTLSPSTQVKDTNNKLGDSLRTFVIADC